MLLYPGLTDVVKHDVNARLAVPVTPQITVGLQYDTAHYQGDYATALVQGLDARKNTYLGNVTYQLPNTSSAITLSARRYMYQDTFAPAFNLTQTRADLNFTVKF
jgi:hemolysin activation/secretion protein